MPSAWRRATVYAVVDVDGKLHWRWTPKPAVDAAYWRRAGASLLVSLAPPLPAMWAELACRTAQQLPLEHDSSEHLLSSFLLRSRLKLRRERNRLPFQAGDLVHRLHRMLRRFGCEDEVRVGEVVYLEKLDDCMSFDFPEDDLAAVEARLAGRLLAVREMEKLMEREGAALGRSVAECLAWLALEGRVEQRPGVRRGPLGVLQCGRCGETEALHAWDCAACGSRECWQCEACRSMGVVRSCTVLYAAAAEPFAPSARPATVEIRAPRLTPAQRRAADALARFVDERFPARPTSNKDGTAGAKSRQAPRDALVWAVCGAGKTEMAFAAVGKVLAQGGRVLFAVPRRDVVRQLGERLRAAFPGIQLQVLHGGADRVVTPVLAPGSLTVATTHQVLRYYQAFDLVVLDEVDAYPYRGSRMLSEAVVRATAPGGMRIRMTATPEGDLLRQAAAGETVLIRVPARHHGYPLPVPELIVDRELDGAQAGLYHQQSKPFRPSRRLMSLIARSLTGTPPGRVLLFVPTVLTAERVGRGLAETMRGDVLWSHSRDPERDAKLATFLRGEGKLFVATSILERGVTVPDADVIVLYADDERVFRVPALIQMAGRVGRTVERPTGRVAFVGRRVTAAMRTAVRHIESMNEEAAALGLLRTPLHETSAQETSLDDLEAFSADAPSRSTD